VRSPGGTPHTGQGSLENVFNSSTLLIGDLTPCRVRITVKLSFGFGAGTFWAAAVPVEGIRRIISRFKSNAAHDEHTSVVDMQVFLVSSPIKPIADY